jgi:hypothetical protein
MLATNPEPTAPQKPYRIERVIVPSTGKIKKEEWLQNVQQSSRTARQPRSTVPGGSGGYPGYPGMGRGAYPGYPGMGRPPQAAPTPTPKKDDKPGTPPRPAPPNSRGGALGAEAMEDLFVDPLTKESLKDDYSITLLAVVVLDPEVEKPAEGTPADANAVTTGTDASQPAPESGAAVPAAAPIPAPETPAAPEGTAPADGTQPAPADATETPAAPAPADAIPSAIPSAVPAAVPPAVAPGTVDGQPEQAK